MTTTTAGVWAKFQGDDWSWTWTTTDDVSSYSDPRITIRASRSSTATVLATTESGTPTITTTGTDFSAGTLAWQIAAAITAEIEPGLYWMEVEVLIASKVSTILSHSFRVLPQVAVAA